MTTSGNHLIRQRPAGKRLNDTKVVNRKFPVGSWVLRYYPPAAHHKLGSPWIGSQQVIRQATGHTVGIQKEPEKPYCVCSCGQFEIMPGTPGYLMGSGCPFR